MDNEKTVYRINEADLMYLMRRLEGARSNLLVPRRTNRSIAHSITAVNDCLRKLSSIRSNQPRERF